MIRFKNEGGFDGWICVPERVDADFIGRMSAHGRKLTVEYGNEIWT